MKLKLRPSLYIVSAIAVLVLLWASSILWLGQPPLFPGGLRIDLFIIALWALVPAIWFVIEDYGWTVDSNWTRLQSVARNLWIAVGAITIILTIRAFIVNQLANINRGPVAWNIVVDILHAAMWPAVVLLSLALFREPLGAFFRALGTRASKIGAFNLTIELTDLPEARPWSGPALDDLRSETPTTARDSSGSLFKAIADTTHADYLTINLESGNAWLTSRLFILASLIPRVRPIKRIVFLAGPTEKFIGDARPSDVAAILADKYPWLDHAYVASHVFADTVQSSDPAPTPPTITSRLVHQFRLIGELDPMQAPMILGSFLDKVKGKAESVGWVQFKSHAEHADWITVESLLQLLGRKLNPSYIKRDPAADEVTSMRTLLRMEADYIAIVDTFDRFRHLIDRYRALDQVVRQQTAQSS